MKMFLIRNYFKKKLSQRIVRKEGNILFKDALITFYIYIYGVRHIVKDHSDSERENPLQPHGLLFPQRIVITFVQWCSQHIFIND